MKKTHLWLLSALGGLLLALSWPANGFAPLALVAFVPLFFVEDFVLKQQRKQAQLPKKERTRYSLFGYAFGCFLLWNALTTWWIWNSTPAALFAIVFNTSLMSLVFWLFHSGSRRFFTKGTRWIVLFVYWLGFEHFHQNWDLSWPWLTLGNAFANYPCLVQWYEITGVSGGSLWILLCNVAVFHLLKTCLERKKSGLKFSVKALVSSLCVVMIPLLISWIRYVSYQPKGKPVEVVVVQPNIDPYGEQYFLPAKEVAQRMLMLTSLQITPQTRFVVTPESMLQEYIWEEVLSSCPSIKTVQTYLQDHPQTHFLAGISSYSRVKPKDSMQEGVRRFRYAPDPALKFYRAHNAVVELSSDTASPIPLYHKSKLTPGVEIMPFAGTLPFIEKWALDLGGTVGTLGIDPEPKVFGDSLKFSSIICYESVFGNYVAWGVKKGATLLFISTNDGWWGNTPGHRQHAAYARLRAIENRRDIARSANTGISCFIDQKGRVSQETDYWQPDCIRQTLLANEALSFYSKYGDVLGRCALPLSGFLLLLTLVYRLFPAAWSERVRLLRREQTPSPRD